MSAAAMRRLTLLCALAACDPAAEAPGHAQQPIFEGAADDLHEAVVAYVSEVGSCSAVIFEVSGDRGHALTAAHCAGGALGVLRQGRDASAPDAEYPVIDAVAHPLAAEVSAFDVAILRFGRAAASTPWLPLLDPQEEELATGDPLELVGYGLTEKGPSRTRRSVTLLIHELALTRMLFDQQTGGFCSGDSGGPALTVSGPPRVVAVLQNVAPDCRGIGMAGRLSAIHDSFLQPVLAGAAPAPPSCAACLEGATFTGSACAAAAETCAAQPACASFARCVDACSFVTCRSACREAEPAGALLHAPLERCLCDTCASACVAHGRCEAASPAPADPHTAAPPASHTTGCSLAPATKCAPLWLPVAAALTLRRRRGRLKDA